MAFGSSSFGSASYGSGVDIHKQPIQKRWQGIPGMKYMSGRQGAGW